MLCQVLLKSQLTVCIDNSAMVALQARLNKNYSITKMDPYCRIRVGHAVFETHTSASGGKMPVWNKVIHAWVTFFVRTLELSLACHVLLTVLNCFKVSNRVRDKIAMWVCPKSRRKLHFCIWLSSVRLQVATANMHVWQYCLSVTHNDVLSGHYTKRWRVRDSNSCHYDLIIKLNNNSISLFNVTCQATLVALSLW